MIFEMLTKVPDCRLLVARHALSSSCDVVQFERCILPFSAFSEISSSPESYSVVDCRQRVFDSGFTLRRQHVVMA